MGSDVSLPQVRRYDVAPGRGIVHIDPSGSPTIVDGSAQSLADLAAFGALPSHRAVQYAGDLNAGSIRREAAAGADLVVGDSNRRREFVPQQTQQNLGPTMAPATPSPPERP